MHFWSPWCLVRGSCSTGFAGECQAEAKLKMEDEVKIEEGPNILSFLQNKKVSSWILRTICDLECPRGRRNSMVFFG